MKSAAAMFITPGSSRYRGSMTLHSNTCLERGAPVTILLSQQQNHDFPIILRHCAVTNCLQLSTDGDFKMSY